MSMTISTRSGVASVVYRFARIVSLLVIKFSAYTSSSRHSVPAVGAGTTVKQAERVQENTHSFWAANLTPPAEAGRRQCRTYTSAAGGGAAG